MSEDRKTEYAMGGATAAALRELAKASGHDLEYVVRLAQNGELRRIFAGGKIFRIHTPLSSDDEPNDKLSKALARRASRVSPRAAQLALMAKRWPT